MIDLGIPAALTRFQPNIEQVLRIYTSDDRSPRREIGHAPDVVEVWMRHRHRVAMRRSGVPVQARQVWQRADAQKARYVKRRVPRHLEVLVLSVEALAKVEEQPAILRLDEDLVPADLSVPTVDCTFHAITRRLASRGPLRARVRPRSGFYSGA